MSTLARPRAGVNTSPSPLFLCRYSVVRLVVKSLLLRQGMCCICNLHVSHLSIYKRCPLDEFIGVMSEKVYHGFCLSENCGERTTSSHIVGLHRRTSRHPDPPTSVASFHLPTGNQCSEFPTVYRASRSGSRIPYEHL